MRGSLLGALMIAATLASGAASAAEQYVPVQQLVVRFESDSAHLRLLVVKLKLAVAAEDAATAKADRRRIEAALQEALSAVSFDDYAASNLAGRVKSIGKTALRRAKLGYVGEVLVQDARLM